MSENFTARALIYFFQKDLMLKWFKTMQSRFKMFLQEGKNNIMVYDLPDLSYNIILLLSPNNSILNEFSTLCSGGPTINWVICSIHIIRNIIKISYFFVIWNLKLYMCIIDHIVLNVWRFEYFKIYGGYKLVS